MNLIDFAKEHNAELFPPIGEDQITAFETERGLILPKELREFYLTVNGPKEFTEWIWRIWQFDELTTLDRRIREAPDIECLIGYSSCPELSDDVAFIDMLIELPLYAVCANPKNPKYGEVISFSGGSKPFLAGPIQTFDEFLFILERHWDDGLLPF